MTRVCLAPHLSVQEGGDDQDGALEVQALIAATWSVTARAGSMEPSVREILDHAGLSTKAFYRHFRSKDELLIRAFDEGTHLLVEYLEHRMNHKDPLSNVGEWIEGFVRQATPPVARRSLPWSIGIGRIAMLFPDEYARHQTEIVAPLEREIAHAVARGEAESPDPGADAWLIYGYCVHTVCRHLIHGTAPDRATAVHLVTFAHRALGRSPASG